MKSSLETTPKNKAQNAKIMIANKELTREAQEFYVNGTVEDLPVIIENLKNKKVLDIIHYAENHKVPIYNKFGEEIGTGIKNNPLVISNYFFKSINPLNSKEPIYSAEQLDLVFEYYNYLITEINDKIGTFPSSLTSFCKLAGIRVGTLRNYRDSVDLDLRVIAEKIYEQIGDDNLALSQMGEVKERSTFYKISAQNEINEKVQPKVSINIKETVNTQKLDNNLEKYKALLEKN